MTHDIVQTSAADTLPPFDPSTFWTQFHHDNVVIEGVRLHFVEGGSGGPILLLPGWPQSWYAWRYVMALLAKAGRRVIALDPRGMGDSDRPASGYDMRTVAAELHGFVEALGLTEEGPVDIACHDLGTWIGYSYAAEWPGHVKRLAVFEALLPGITPPPPAGIPSAEVNVKTWQLAFNRLDDLPEILLQGRERELLTWLFQNKSARSWTITPADLGEYVRVNAAPGATRAALSYYRQNLGPAGIAETRARAERKLAMPVLAFGADMGVGALVLDTMRLIAADARGGVFAGCGHYVAEEAPRAVAEQIIRFMGQ
jgi:pimeloyl-ACP methyl ester carboxylesterase